jgi:hypothetical protein
MVVMSARYAHTTAGGGEIPGDTLGKEMSSNPVPRLGLVWGKMEMLSKASCERSSRDACTSCSTGWRLANGKRGALRWRPEKWMP